MAEILRVLSSSVVRIASWRHRYWPIAETLSSLPGSRCKTSNRTTHICRYRAVEDTIMSFIVLTLKHRYVEPVGAIRRLLLPSKCRVDLYSASCHLYVKSATWILAMVWMHVMYWQWIYIIFLDWYGVIDESNSDLLHFFCFAASPDWPLSAGCSESRPTWWATHLKCWFKRPTNVYILLIKYSTSFVLSGYFLTFLFNVLRQM